MPKASSPATSFVSRPSVYLLLIPILILAAIAYWVFTPAQPAPAAGPQGGLPVEATPAITGNLAETLTVVGQVQANLGITLKAEIAGRITATPVPEGSEVTSGTALFRIDNAVQQAQLLQAQANATLASNTVGRNQRLAEIGASSKQQLETAEADAKLARANVQLARANLAKTNIIAPFDGTFGIRQVEVGTYVNPGDTLATLTDNTSLKVNFSAPADAASNLQPGIPITISADDGATLTVGLTAVDGAIDPTTRTRAAQATFTNQDNAFISGQFVRVTIPVKQTQSAVLIPEQALVPQGQDTFVYVITPGKQGTTMASRTTVQVGLRTNGQAEILQGVAPNQQVVTAGQMKLRAPLMPVTVLSPTVVTPAPSPVEELPKTGGA